MTGRKKAGIKHLPIILSILIFLPDVPVFSWSVVPALIPMSGQMEWSDENFSQSEQLVILADFELQEPLTDYLELIFSDFIIRPLNYKSLKTRGAVILKIEASDLQVPNKNECYPLSVNRANIILSASSDTGVFRGIQTLRQLKSEKDGKTYFAGCSITDWPSFKIRGFMQDVGRN